MLMMLLVHLFLTCQHFMSLSLSVDEGFLGCPQWLYHIIPLARTLLHLNIVQKRVHLILILGQDFHLLVNRHRGLQQIVLLTDALLLHGLVVGHDDGCIHHDLRSFISEAVVEVERATFSTQHAHVEILVQELRFAKVHQRWVHLHSFRFEILLITGILVWCLLSEAHKHCELACLF